MSSSDRTPPLYGLGQWVMVRSRIDPARNTDSARVIDRQWFDGMLGERWYRGWQYVVHRHLDAWAVEASLRPRPTPARASWTELRDSLAEPGHPQHGEPVRTRESAAP